MDDINTFITEHLLNLQERDFFFFKNVLGGFTLSPRTPTHSVCGCGQLTRGNLTSCISQFAQIDILNSLPLSNNDAILTGCPTSSTRIPLFCDDDPLFLNLTLPSLDITEIIDRLTLNTNDTSNMNTLCNSNTINGSNLDTLLIEGENRRREVCLRSTQQLSQLGCQLLDDNTSFVCIDSSCALCDGSNGGSISSQYSCTRSEDRETVLTLWYNNQVSNNSNITVMQCMLYMYIV